jgi:hypothetical protein
MPLSSVFNRTPTTTQIRVAIPDEILDQYQAQAQTLGIDVETLLARRLAQAVEYTASKPLYFSDADRQELEQTLGKNVLHTRDAISQIKIAMTVRIHNLKVQLKPAVLTRLKTRCLGMGWEEFVEQRVVQALEQYVGMR